MSEKELAAGGGAVAPQLTEDEKSDVQIGLAFLALHHREQIRDWSVRPRGKDRRNKYVRDWLDNKDRIIAHHERRIAELSALVGRLGGRDWVAAEKSLRPSSPSAQAAPE